MLTLTLINGERIQIGEDVQIVFESQPAKDRIKVSIDAPKEIGIVRMPVKKQKKANIVIVRNDKMVN